RQPGELGSGAARLGSVHRDGAVLVVEQDPVEAEVAEHLHHRRRRESTHEADRRFAGVGAWVERVLAHGGPSILRARAAPRCDTPGGMSSDQKCAGKIVLVTGAQRGIGRAIAVRFAQAGADVALNYLDDKAAAESAAAEIVALGRRAATAAPH